MGPIVWALLLSTRGGERGNKSSASELSINNLVGDEVPCSKLSVIDSVCIDGSCKVLASSLVQWIC